MEGGQGKARIEDRGWRMEGRGKREWRIEDGEWGSVLGGGGLVAVKDDANSTDMVGQSRISQSREK